MQESDRCVDTCCRFKGPKRFFHQFPNMSLARTQASRSLSARLFCKTHPTMPFLSELFPFLETQSLWPSQRAKAFLWPCLENKPRDGHEEEVPLAGRTYSWNRGCPSWGRRNDREAISSGSLLQQHRSAVWGTAVAPWSDKGQSLGTLDRSCHLCPESDPRC